jgi:hypothetical protein
MHCDRVYGTASGTAADKARCGGVCCYVGLQGGFMLVNHGRFFTAFAMLFLRCGSVLS